MDRFTRLFAHVVRCTCSWQHRTLPVADRDDLVAEIFLEIVRNNAAVLRGFAGRSPLAAYLAVVARRVVVRKLHRGTRHPQPMPSVEPEAKEELPAKEEADAILSRLEDSEALLVRLHHFEARSYGEISRLTGLPLGSIGPALSKAREKLRQAGA